LWKHFLNMFPQQYRLTNGFGSKETLHQKINNFNSLEQSQFATVTFYNVDFL
jgi:hypothetical protein